MSKAAFVDKRFETSPITGIPPHVTRYVCLSDIHSGKMDSRLIPKGHVLINAGDFVQNFVGYSTGNLPSTMGKQLKYQHPSTAQETLDSFKWMESLGFQFVIAVAGNHDVILEHIRREGMRQVVPHFDKFDMVSPYNPTGAAENQLRAYVNNKRSNFIYLDHQHCQISTKGDKDTRPVRIYGAPYSLKRRTAAFTYPSSENPWKQIPKSTNILITHGPPLHKPSRIGAPRLDADLLCRSSWYRKLDPNSTPLDRGDPKLAEAINLRPSINACVFGHQHEAAGTDYVTYIDQAGVQKKRLWANVSVGVSNNRLFGMHKGRLIGSYQEVGPPTEFRNPIVFDRDNRTGQISLVPWNELIKLQPDLRKGCSYNGCTAYIGQHPAEAIPTLHNKPIPPLTCAKTIKTMYQVKSAVKKVLQQSGTLNVPNILEANASGTDVQIARMKE